MAPAESIMESRPMIAFSAVSAVFGSLGQAVICVDADMRILHVSPLLEKTIGARGHDLTGRPASELFGVALFGPSGTLRRAVELGETREGWRVPVEGVDRPVVVSLTVVPLRSAEAEACDRRIRAVLLARPLTDEVEPEPGPVDEIVARSEPMHGVAQLIETLHTSEATVLITGEPGSGRKLVARVIHQHSPRRFAPFVTVPCAALPRELADSELFGHVRGAWAGADRDRVGRFELAAHGTILLDEVDHLSIHTQERLARALSERRFTRVGESYARPLHARIIATTSADLRRRVAEGRFRRDLFSQLDAIPVEVPALRDRREDIEPLIEARVATLSARREEPLRVAPDAMRLLLDYDWPGNVHELEAAIDYAASVASGTCILATDLPREIATAERVAEIRTPALPEAQRLRSVLNQHQWRREAAAEALGISRTTLWRRMRQLGLLSGKD